MLIAIGGGIGCGKSLVSKYLEERGYNVAYSDKISRAITQKGEPALIEIEQAFGRHILNGDETLNRKLLGKIVFSDESKLKILNEITHRRVMNFILEESKKHGLLFVEIPLLFENGNDKIFDIKIYVTADLEARIERIRMRDNLSRGEVIERINSQLPFDKVANLCDYIIYNDRDINHLHMQTDCILKQLNI